MKPMNIYPQNSASLVTFSNLNKFQILRSNVACKVKLGMEASLHLHKTCIYCEVEFGMEVSLQMRKTYAYALTL